MSFLQKMAIAASSVVMRPHSYSAYANEVIERPQSCQQFSDIYADGRELCENMWDGAFRYETDEDQAYTMWFFDHDNNPNDAITETLVNMGLITGLEGTLDQCYLAYFHKDGSHHIDNGLHPTEEPANFQECHPWSESSCCFQETVESAEKLNAAYGEGYRWDRCGPLSPACERFFVQEACFYECEPNIGLYRKYLEPGQPNPRGVNGIEYDPACDPYAIEYDASLNCDHNTWQVSGMPIKASFCDAWWLACRDDYFCAHGGGSYFSCADVTITDTSNVDSPTEEDKNFSTTIVSVTAVACLIGGVALTAIFMTISNTKRKQQSTRNREESTDSFRSDNSNTGLVGKMEKDEVEMNIVGHASI